ncbi:MAG: hypothetical protein L0Y39_12665 [Methylococcaceae bacterium]|nr:hypothetical protein [Methylococcaceae bacterium]
MRLNSFQATLESIYRIKVEHSVEDFLITDAALARQLDTSVNAREVKEKLLIRSGSEGLDVSLYLDQSVVDHLDRENPLVGLHGGNLSDFWIALEGVSHFLYLMWNARVEKPVTLMELEMQAEVDKYIASWWLMKLQEQRWFSRQIRDDLFHRVRFDESLDDQSLTRYKDANFYAGKYCMQLEDRYLRKKRNQMMIDDIRHFYRLPQAGKIRRIQYC